MPLNCTLLPSIKQTYIKSYQQRTSSEHNLAIAILQQNLPDCPFSLAKSLSFFAIMVVGQIILTEKNYEQNSLVLHYDTFGADNPQTRFKCLRIQKNVKIIIDRQSYAIVITHKDYLKSLILNLIQSSIEQEIQFLNQCQYFQSVPRKKCYFLLRHSDIISYSINQTPYKQKSLLIDSNNSTSSIYLVREGQFCYLKDRNHSNQPLQIFKFTSNHLFGTEELFHQIKSTNRRHFTIACCSSRGIVYKFDQVIFNFIKKYCEGLLIEKQSKLKMFMDQSSTAMKIHLQKKQSFLSQTLSNEYFTSKQSKQISNNLAINNNRSTALNFKSHESIDLPHKEGKSTILSSSSSVVKKDILPNLIKLSKFNFSKGDLHKMNELQYKDIQKLMEKKQKCQTMRKLSKTDNNMGRGEVLFHLFKKSWQFQKDKRKSTRLT